MSTEKIAVRDVASEGLQFDDGRRLMDNGLQVDLASEGLQLDVDGRRLMDKGLQEESSKLKIKGTRRRWFLIALIIAIVVVATVIAGVLGSRTSSNGRKNAETASSPSPAAVGL